MSRREKVRESGGSVHGMYIRMDDMRRSCVMHSRQCFDKPFHNVHCLQKLPNGPLKIIRIIVMRHSWSFFVSWSQKALSRTLGTAAEVQVASNLEGVSPVSPVLDYSSSFVSRHEQRDTTLDTEDIGQGQVLNVEQDGVTLAGSSEAVVQEQPPHQSHGSDNVATMLMLILAVLLVVATIAVSVAVVIVGNKNDSAAPVGVIVPRRNSTVDYAYLQEIRTILVPLPIWAETNAPQLRATEFMAYTDSSHVNVTSSRLQQRYALLVLYFANGGERWPMDPLLHECDWTFVACNNQSVVTKLLMGDRIEMSGQLPAEIGLLSHVGK
jgi:hypothetical protein